MSDKNDQSRRKFLRNLGGSAFLLAAGPLSGLSAEAHEERILLYEKKWTSNDKVRIGVIGLGIMGNNDLKTALQVPGVELGGVCDLYTGRLERAKELYGKDLFTTKDYRALLERKDIDAVIIATSDQWHAPISIAAMKAGKAVYCEKPMVHLISEGQAVIKAQQETKKVMQVGSQRVSSVVYAKARELYQSGAIGKLNMVQASFDRQSALGAWEYTMPTDASAATVDWNRYVANSKRKMDYDPKKFFWWRNYREFGTGVAGDLFVHLISGVHVITGAKGPERIFSSGQLSYWKDGRDVPDVMTAIMHYPKTAAHEEFQLMLRVNFISGEGDRGSVKLIGEEGAMELRDNSLLITHSVMPKAPGIGGWDALFTYPEAMQKQLKEAYNSKYSSADQETPRKPDVSFKAPAGYNEHLDHFTNFFESMRSGKPVVEDAVFGFRAAAPCLACNESYFSKKTILWDPEKMEIRQA